MRREASLNVALLGSGTTVLKWAPLGGKTLQGVFCPLEERPFPSFRRTVSMSVIAENPTTQTQEKLFQV